jgi:hypothetical protein
VSSSLLPSQKKEVKIFDWFTTPYKGGKWAEHEWHYSASISMLLPSKPYAIR